MGWDFTQGATKKQIVESLNKAWTSATPSEQPLRVRVLAHRVVGNTLWQVTIKEAEGLDGEWQELDRAIYCNLLKSERGYGWGYKSLSESAHPYYYDCPLSYLDMVPVACQDWREKVRAYHAEAEKQKAIVNGVVVVFPDGVRFSHGTETRFQKVGKAYRALTLNFRCSLPKWVFDQNKWEVVS